MDSRSRMFVTLLLILLFVVPAAPANANGVPDPFLGCERGVSGNGASWAICMPERIPGLHWNGNLIIYAHGYVSPFPARPPEIPLEQYVLPGGTSFPAVANSLGYAFATTSFRTNGLAVKDGVADIVQLWGEFKSRHRLKPSAYTYLFGASEGGLITAKAIEQKPAQFDGGIAACGPIGDFRQQVNWVGDMRVVYDALFAGKPPVLPPTAISIPESLMVNWSTVFVPGIGAQLLNPANAALTGQLLAVTQAPYEPNDPMTIPQTVLGVLWYNVYGTNDAIAKMGGNPFDNTTRRYAGSLDDAALNAAVARFQADRNALASIQAHYQTTGRLKTPLVTMHNIGDPVVPYWHEALYAEKVTKAGATRFYRNIPVASYGHCNFTAGDIANALQQLLEMSGNTAVSGVDQAPASKTLNRGAAP